MSLEEDSTKSFNYQPLDATRKETRIVELHPGQGQDDIRCTLHHAALGDRPIYKTVSYCWGDALSRASCYLNNHSISIPQSSANVLRQARSTFSSECLWIDAICINQNDVEERDQQVALMREIYSSSLENLIFLDVELEHASASFELFQRFWLEARFFTKDFENLNFIIRRPGVVPKAILSLDETTAYLAVVFSPWFRRVWVMQEAALAPFSTCYIGDHRVPLVDLLRAFRWREYKYIYSTDVSVHPTEVNTALRNILTLWKYVDPSYPPYRDNNGSTISDALVFGRGLKSSQSRDHVFGLLGLIRYRSLSSAILERLRPAYARSILDIFRDAMLAALMERNGTPDYMFEEIIYRNKELPLDSWPSWVPDWSLARDLDVHPGRLNKWYFAAGGQGAFDFTEVDQNSIQVRGVLVDIVSSATSICRAREWKGGAARVASWLQEVDTLAPGQRGQVVNTTLLAGLTSGGSPVKRRDLDEFEILRQTLSSGIDSNSDGSNQLVELFERTCNNRRFFNTSTGYLGIGPNISQPGDVVVVFQGCRAPIILRPCEQAHYSVIGESYVYGIMNGEAFIHEERSESELFVLR